VVFLNPGQPLLAEKRQKNAIKRQLKKVTNYNNCGRPGALLSKNIDRTALGL
jgi:hypothetical protein